MGKSQISARHKTHALSYAAYSASILYPQNIP